ncbi:MAG TPA: TonB-dependent receptor [Gemmatimonadales bacterium]|jgi:vitamin B12 transporter|nr:TonB-dependent receptor [Gemmatimonadales bacterium]
MNVALLLIALTAQQPSPQDTVVLKPLVVTATRVPVPADVVASAVTVLRGSDLEAQGIRTAAEALETVPGAHIAETGSFGGQTSLFMRGGESDYTKILVDGVPFNQAGGAIDLAHLTTDNIDRIEIVRGPVSVLYGSDAVTGVVQIFTRTGHGPAQLGAELHAATYGSTDAAIDVAGSHGKIGYAARVSRFSADGLYRYNNRYRNSVASARIQVTPDARTDASLTYRYGDDSYHFPTNGYGAAVDSNQRSAERGPLLSLTAGRILGQHLDARITGAMKESRLFYNDEPDSPGEDGTFWSKDWVRRATASALLTWRKGQATSLMGGIEYEDQQQRGTSEFSASFGTFPNPPVDVQRTNTGYFTQAVISAGQSAVTLGGRLDDNSQFGTHGTYRAGLVYRLAHATRARFSVGTGFKEPSFFENYATGIVRGNPHLKPERSRSFEVGLERGAVAVTYFNQRFRNLIEYSGTRVGPDSANYFNVGGAIADGIEATASTSVATSVVLSLNYTFLHTRVEKSGSSDPNGLFVPGKPLIRRPAHTLAPQLSATVGARGRINVGALWVGKRDDVGAQRVTMNPYTRVNVSGEYTVGRVVLSGRLDNVFNDQRQEINGYRPRGRTVTLGGRITVAR